MRPQDFFSVANGRGEYIWSGLHAILVDADNPYYKSKNGLLLSKDEKTLYAAPGGNTGVNVPNTVTKIEDACFALNKNLKKVTLNNDLEEIGGYAFRDCSSLEEIVIPDKVKNDLTGTFINCTSLKSISIGKGVNYINGIFEGCSSLKNITVNSNNNSYAVYEDVLYSKDKSKLIYYPAGLTGAFSIPNTTTSIEHYAFANSKLTSVYMPDTVTDLGIRIFEDSSIKNIRLSNNIFMIPIDTFFNSSIEEIEIPSSVEVLEDGVFRNCKKLYKLIIPSSVTSVGKGIIKGCDNLTDITIPSQYLENQEIGMLLHSVTIRDNDNNILLKTIVPDGKSVSYTGKNPTKEGYTFTGWDTDLSSIESSVVVKPIFKENPKKVTFLDENNKIISSQEVEKGSSAKAPEIPQKPGYIASWDNDFSNIQDDLTVKIKYSPLYKTKDVDGGICITDYLGTDKDVVIPDEIDGKKVLKLDETFKNDTNITTVTMADTIEEITGNTFSHCKNLTKIKLSNNINTLETFAIYECKNLKEIILPENLKTLKSCAVIMVPNITEISLPKNLKVIEKYAFDQCPKLESIIVPSSVEKINDNAFANLLGLKKFSIIDGNNNIEIGSEILLGCNVDSIDVPEKYIGKVNFGGNVNNVIFKDSDGTILNSQLVLTGKDAKEPAKPSKQDYEFTGWSREFKKVTGNLEVVAQYTAKIPEIKNYTVMFKDMNGNIIDKQIVQEGLAANAPNAPVVEGYTFKSWDNDYFNITKDTIINGQYEKNPEKYSVIFKDYDGKIINTQEVEEGLSAKEIVPPEREGYTFKGWDKSFDKVTCDLEVIALYEENVKENPEKDKEDATVTPGHDEEEKKDEDKTSSDVEGSTGGTSIIVDKGQTSENPSDKTAGTESEKTSDSKVDGETEKPTDGTGNKSGDIAGVGVIGSLFTSLYTMVRIIKRKNN